MRNSGLRITATVFREDGSMAQEVIFDQRGLTYKQLLQLQSQAVQPCAMAIMTAMDSWNQEANAKAEAEGK